MVMSLFAKNAMIIPSGSKSIKGYENIKKYWWPNDGSITKITAYESPVSNFQIFDNTVIAIGTGKLSFYLLLMKKRREDFSR